MPTALAEAAGRSEKPLKAAFSNAGLQATWCAQGKQAAEYWGKLFNVDVTWFDGQLDAVKQRAAIDNMASQKWDFVAIQAFGIGTLTAPVNKMIDAGIPVIDMDTLIAPLDTINVLTFLAPDNEFMGASVTQALVNAINGEGTIVMTQGALGHTGAQGRAKGFHSVVSKFPKIQVLDEQPADWDVTKVARIWETLLTKYPKIDAAFFHNDDMALAALQGDGSQGPHGDQGRRRRRHAPGNQGGAGRQDVCHRPQPVMPYPWRSDRRRSASRRPRREDGHGHSEEHRHRRAGRHQAERRRDALDAGAVPDLILRRRLAMALLELTGVSKSFGGVQALRGVDFTLLRRSDPWSGRRERRGQEHDDEDHRRRPWRRPGTCASTAGTSHFRSSRDARAAGIGMVHQELSVAPELSVAENVFLGSQPVNRLGIVAWRRMAEAAAVQLKNLGLDIDPRARLGDFPIGVQQLVELSRVLFSGARIIILDEPTSALSPPEIERLFAVLAKLRESGRSIIFISHFLDDILKVSDAITIFRNGRNVATTDVTPAIDKGWIIERMIGAGREELEESYLGEIMLSSRPDAPVALRATALTLAPSYRDVTFEARAGEVLGIYGFMGCGQLELARTLFGRLRADSGSLEIDGEVKALSNTAAAKSAGVAYVAESRRSMLFSDEPVYKNVSIAVLERLSRWLLKPEREREIAAEQVKALDIRPPRSNGVSAASPAATSRRSRWRSG